MSLTLWGLKKSPWVYHVALSPCNNCDIEILDVLTPRFDVERFGVKLVGSPRHADALLVSGSVNRHVLPRFVELYKQTAKPCVVFGIGSCALTMTMFRDSYNMVGPLDKVVKEIDPNAIVFYIPGCPPKPEAIILGVVKALNSL